MKPEDESKTEGNGTDVVSPRKLQANRENARKSTGPKTSRGKLNSCFNAATHGLTAKRLMFGGDGKLINNDLHELIEALRDRYGRGDVVTELLIESVAVDYWRQAKGLDAEIRQHAKAAGLLVKLETCRVFSAITRLTDVLC